MALREIESAKRRFPLRTLIAVVFVLLLCAHAIASYIIDFEWWRGMDQLNTWFNMLLYGLAPALIAMLIAFIVFWAAHRLALRFAGVRLRDHRLYSRLSTLALLLIAAVLSFIVMDTWTAVRFFGGHNLGGSTAWHDPVFNLPLAFYLFRLPFYSNLLHLVLAIAIIAIVIYWIAARGWQLSRDLPAWTGPPQIDFRDFRLTGALESGFVRGLAAVILLALAVRFYLDRYSLLLGEHGFMVGIDYVDRYIALPLIWLVVAACIVSAIAASVGRFRWLLLVVAALIVRAIVPSIVGAVYVRPNEISLETPFIKSHIEATRSAFGIDNRTSEIDFQAKPESNFSIDANKDLLDNVRLWDWSAFHSTVSQMQPLRPYVYSETDVDRYMIGGELRQVLVSPRELDLNALGDARSRWINPHFIYTHGYGIVMAEANRIDPNGLPVLYIRDAPPVISVPDLKLTRPEIYYGEEVHEPVFVRTAQPEFNYPSGGDNVNTRYSGTGGFPISSVFLRTAAAVSGGDWNILLTSYLTPQSRMMIHRKVTDRLNTLAGFVMWDADPYLVLTPEGRLVWIVDGYMTSDVHPYSKEISFDNGPSFNYIRNSVKATVDAYDGTAHLYVFDEHDPLVNAYRNLFPHLFLPESAMPPALRAHARYPEMIFSAQAEIYRLFHMRDPETFYNKSDAWDIAKFTSGQGEHSQNVAPTYLIASLPGSQKPEFMLMIPFTPRNRDNLIGLMMARCDGDHLGEKVVLLLSKQEIIRGPLQVEANINQDQNISKDLSLWNQQGSQVLRGQMLVLPIDHTFLYVEPIYIQASEARMPQLRKVALAMGNTLIYANTYDEALSQLAARMGQTYSIPEVPGAPEPPQPTQPSTAAVAPSKTSAAPPATGAPDPRIAEIRHHLERYRDLVSQGKWSEAGKELEAVQALVGQKK